MRAVLRCCLTTLLLAASLVPALAQTPRWVELPPPPLSGGAALYDIGRDRMLFVGGSADALGRGTVWSLAFPAMDWKELSYLGAVPAIQPQAVIHDPVADRLVAFIGPAALSNSAATFQLDLTATPPAWSQLTVAGTAPDARAGYSAVYDPLRQRMLVFGGFVSGGPTTVYSNKVWALSLSGSPTWSQLAVLGTPPSGRQSHTAVYDPAADRMVVFGGALPPASPGGTPIPLDETWSLALAGTPTWSFLPPSGSIPSARSNHSAAVDPSGHRMLAFGGRGSTLVRDTWSLDLAASTSNAVWTRLDLASGPTARWFAQACWDGTRGRMLVGGGLVARATDVVKAADTWAFVPGGIPAWTALTPNTDPPPAVDGYVAALDTTGDRMFVVCGQNKNGTQFGDTWSRSLTSNEGWLLATASGPGVRFGPVGAADPAGNRALLFGGYRSAPATYLNDVLGYGFGPGVWQPLGNAAPPPGRIHPFVAFDDSRRRLMIYGGSYGSISGNHWLEDTWAYDAANETWQQLLTAGSFGSRIETTGIYDPVRDRLIAFGGQDTLLTYNDLHVLPLGAAGAWATLPAAGTPPPPRTGTVAAYDATGDRMIVFVPADPGQSGELGVMTWALSLSGAVIWTPLVADGRIPAARYGTQPIMDARRGRILLHGGAYGESLNDTWAFYLDETTPTLLSLFQADATRERVLIRWYSGEPVHGSAMALRRIDGDAWEPIAELFRDGTGQLVLEDRDILPGQRIEYRVRVTDLGLERYFGEVTLTIPTSSAIRLLGPHSNPVVGDLRVAFELAGNAPARIELLDIAGRRILSRDLTGLGDGGHDVLLSPSGANPPAGIYFLRLTQGGSVRSRKIVMAH